MREERKSDAAHLYRSAGTIIYRWRRRRPIRAPGAELSRAGYWTGIELAHRPQKETHFARPLALGPGALHLVAFEMHIQIHR